MPIKVFISYSHKDESHKEQLEEHLSMLKRSKIIDAWHDRKIMAGQDWSNEISTHLENSELILLLISPSFLGSDYCFNLEMNRAIELHKEGKAVLIPIVVRPCDWSSCELGSYQAVPKDANPITSWNNQDEAWLDAIKGIREQLDSYKSTVLCAITGSSASIKPTSASLEWLEDTEVALTHRRANKIKISDVYVSLDMESDELSEKKDIEISTSDIIVTNPNQYLLFGEEQQGKSTLLKHTYQELLKNGALPIYINASDISQSDITRNLSKALKEQYENLSLEQFLSTQNRALLIDDLNEIGLNTKYRSQFLASVNKHFSQVVITCHTSFSYIAPEIQELNDYKKYELLGLGHLKRTEIVEKWISLGIERRPPILSSA
jgi:hypothetical protein